MSLTFDKVDLSGLEKKILEKTIAIGSTLKKELPNEAGLLSLTLVKYTQPFGMGSQAQKLGEGALLRDLTEAFYILPDELVQKAVIIQGGEFSGFIRIFATKAGIVWITHPTNWHVTDPISVLQQYHESVRTKDGRVRRNRNKVDHQNRMAIINLWVVTKSQFDGLLKFISPRIGYAKGGWATVCRKLGRSNTEIPAWIKNHNAPGSVIDRTSDPKPSISIVNEVNYTGRVLSDSAKKEAIEERRTKITLAIDRAIKYGVKGK